MSSSKKHIENESPQEPLLEENEDRFVLFPLVKFDIFSLYKTFESSFWTLEDIDFSTNQSQDFLDSLSEKPEDLRRLIELLTVFYLKDRILPPNIVARLNTEIQASEARFCLSYTIMTANVHKEALNFLIQKLLSNYKQLGLSKNKISLLNLSKSVLQSEKFKARTSLSKLSEDFSERLCEFFILRKLILIGPLLEILSIVDKHSKAWEHNGFAEAFTRILMDDFLEQELFEILIKKYLKFKISYSQANSLIKKILEVEKKHLKHPEVFKRLEKELSEVFEEESNKLYEEWDEKQAVVADGERAVDILRKWEEKVEKEIEEVRCREDGMSSAVGSNFKSQEFGMSESF